MTKEELAEQITGREYGEEITDAEEKQAKADGLVVIFGYSDDNVEFRGAINDEVGCYDGGDLFVTREGALEEHEDCECKYCGFERRKMTAKKIEAIWGQNDYSWQFKTDMPHVAFEVKEGDQKFCKGIVIHVDDISAF